MAGQMVHVEIPAGDTSSAKEFCTGMFGWAWQGFAAIAAASTT